MNTAGPLKEMLQVEVTYTCRDEAVLGRTEWENKTMHKDSLHHTKIAGQLCIDERPTKTLRLGERNKDGNRLNLCPA